MSHHSAPGWIPFTDVAHCRLCGGPPVHVLAADDFVLPLCARCACQWVHPGERSAFATGQPRAIPCPTCDAPQLPPDQALATAGQPTTPD